MCKIKLQIMQYNPSSFKISTVNNKALRVEIPHFEREIHDLGSEIRMS